MVSNRTLAVIRKRVNTTLTERCRIEREANVRGLMHEPIANQWETVVDDVPCRVITLGQSGSEAESVGSTEVLVERWRLICPAGTAFAVDNRVVLSDDRKFQIVDIDDRLTQEAFVSATMVRARNE